jgi:hypothetical protein
MHYADGHFVDLQVSPAGQPPRPGAGVVIPAHHSQRRNGAQRLQDRRVTDIAGMNDVVAAAEKLERLWAQQSVGVRDEADPAQRYRPSGNS